MLYKKNLLMLKNEYTNWQVLSRNRNIIFEYYIEWNYVYIIMFIYYDILVSNFDTKKIL